MIVISRKFITTMVHLITRDSFKIVDLLSEQFHALSSSHFSSRIETMARVKASSPLLY